MPCQTLHSSKIHFLLSDEATYMSELKSWLVPDQLSAARGPATARKDWIRPQPHPRLQRCFQLPSSSPQILLNNFQKLLGRNDS